MNRQTDFRPRSEAAFKDGLIQGLPLWTDCKKCGEPFNKCNTHTPGGWMDTQITGWCEDCYDEVFDEEE